MVTVIFDDKYDYEKEVIGYGKNELEALKNAKKSLVAKMKEMKQKYLDILVNASNVISNGLGDPYDFLAEIMELYAKLRNAKGAFTAYFAIENVIDRMTKIIRELMKEIPDVAVELLRLTFDIDDVFGTNMDLYKHLIAVVNAYEYVLYREKELECEAKAKETYEKYSCVDATRKLINELKQKARERAKKLFS